MNTKPRKPFSLKRAIIRTLLGCLAFYYVTATAVPALHRHSADGGKLTNVPPSVWKALELYIAPMKLLSGVRPLQIVFEFGADIWWRILDPPDTTP